MQDVKTKLIQQALLPGISEERICNALQVLEKGLPRAEDNNSGFISEPEACRYCGGIARSTLWRWRSRGLASFLVGSRRLYRKSELDLFIIKHSSSIRDGESS